MKVDFCYRYRWRLFIVGNVTVIMLAYLFDVKPLRHQYAKLQKEEKQLNNEVLRLKVKNTKVTASTQRAVEPVFNKIEKMTTMAMSVGLNLQRMTMHKSNFTAEFQGDFKRYAHFIWRMSRASPESSVGDFSYQNGKVELELMPAFFQKELNEKYLSPSNPFCHEEEMRLDANTNPPAFSLNEMRMVGHVQQGLRSLALVQLPNGVLIEVFPNMLLGKEHGKILDINSKEILIELPNKNQFSLSMS